MLKTFVLTLAAAGSLLGAGVANAGVAWSVDIGVPGVAAVVGNRQDPYYPYRPAPRLYVAPPVVYAPVPVYAPPPVVEYAPAPIRYVDETPRFYRPAPVVVAYPEYRYGHRDWDHGRDGRWNHERDERDHRDYRDGRDGRDDRDGHDGRNPRWDGRR